MADEHTGEQDGVGKTRKRRGILAAAGAALGVMMAGIAAKQTVQPVAADGTFVAPGANTANGVTTLRYTGASLSRQNILTVSDGTDFSASRPAAIGGYAEGGMVTNGVFGYTSTAGALYAGVAGVAASGGTGVSGESSDYGTGVQGTCTGHVSGAGMFGVTDIGKAIFGRAFGAGTGVYGQSGGGNGVYGVADVAGTSQVVAGVFGDSTKTYGVIGRTTAAGYSGLTAITGTPGVAALAATATVTSAYAAYFSGTTVVQGDLAVTGIKSAAVKDAAGQHRLVYCVESPESWFEDFGTGTLVGGKAEVKLDPIFTQIAHTDDYHVFITPEGDYHAHVAQKTAAGFAVRQTTGTGSAGASGAFSYRVVARRSDITGERLAKFTLPKINIPDESKLPKSEPPRKP